MKEINSELNFVSLKHTESRSFLYAYAYSNNKQKHEELFWNHKNIASNPYKSNSTSRTDTKHQNERQDHMSEYHES